MNKKILLILVFSVFFSSMLFAESVYKTEEVIASPISDIFIKNISSTNFETQEILSNPEKFIKVPNLKKLETQEIKINNPIILEKERFVYNDVNYVYYSTKLNDIYVDAIGECDDCPALPYKIVYLIIPNTFSKKDIKINSLVFDYNKAEKVDFRLAPSPNKVIAINAIDESLDPMLDVITIPNEKLYEKDMVYEGELIIGSESNFGNPIGLKLVQIFVPVMKYKTNKQGENFIYTLNEVSFEATYPYEKVERYPFRFESLFTKAENYKEFAPTKTNKKYPEQNIPIKTNKQEQNNKKTAGSDPSPEVEGSVMSYTPSNPQLLSAVDLTNPNLDFDYIIITAPEFYPASASTVYPLYEFAMHKKDYNNFNVAIVNFDDIVSTYGESGIEFYGEANVSSEYLTPATNAKNIKNFLNFAWENWDATHMIDNQPGYVLLVGDSNRNQQTQDWFLPTPIVYNIYCETGSDYCLNPPEGYGVGINNFPHDGCYSDLYTNCREYTPTFIVGRFPVQTTAQLETVVDKSIHFEADPTSSGTDESWLSRYSDQYFHLWFATHSDAEEYFYAKPFPAIESKQWEVEALRPNYYGDASGIAWPAKQKEIFEDGVVLATSASHGNVVSGGGGGALYVFPENGDIDNTNKNMIFLSEACSAGSFDDDPNECWVEKIVEDSTYPQRGAVASVGYGCVAFADMPLAKQMPRNLMFKDRVMLGYDNMSEIYYQTTFGHTKEELSADIVSTLNLAYSSGKQIMMNINNRNTLGDPSLDVDIFTEDYTLDETAHTDELLVQYIQFPDPNLVEGRTVHAQSFVTNLGTTTLTDLDFSFYSFTSDITYPLEYKWIDYTLTDTTTLASIEPNETKMITFEFTMPVEKIYAYFKVESDNVLDEFADEYDNGAILVINNGDTGETEPDITNFWMDSSEYTCSGEPPLNSNQYGACEGSMQMCSSGVWEDNYMFVTANDAGDFHDFLSSANQNHPNWINEDCNSRSEVTNIFHNGYDSLSFNISEYDSFWSIGRWYNPGHIFDYPQFNSDENNCGDPGNVCSINEFCLGTGCEAFSADGYFYHSYENLFCEHAECIVFDADRDGYLDLAPQLYADHFGYQLYNDPEDDLTSPSDTYTYYFDADSDDSPFYFSYDRYETSHTSTSRYFGEDFEAYEAMGYDCDDSDIGIHPGAEEVCDGIDNDCSGICVGGSEDSNSCQWGEKYNYTLLNLAHQVEVSYSALGKCESGGGYCKFIDEGLPVVGTYYQDTDEDGYGDPSTEFESCLVSPPVGYVSVGGDCNDTNPNINPGKAEACDEYDNNCDANINEGFDIDSDTYTICGYDTTGIFNGIDCNDINTSINPGATETCNNLDDNCNGEIDEGLGSYNYYQDWDVDGYGNPEIENTQELYLKMNEGDFETVYDYSENNNYGEIKNTLITEFDDSSAGFTTGCGGIPAVEYVNGYSNLSAKLYATGGDGLACYYREFLGLKDGDSFYFYGKGYVKAGIYSGETTHWQSITLEDIESGDSYSATYFISAFTEFNSGNPYEEWRLFKLTLNEEISTNDGKIYFYNKVGVGEEYASYYDLLKEGKWIDDTGDNIIDFDGNETYIDIEDDDSINFGTDNFAISFWIKTDTASATEYLLDKRNTALSAGGTGFYIYQTANGKIAGYIGDGTNLDGGYMTNTIIDNNEWHNIILNFDRLSGYVYSYVDGNIIVDKETDISFATGSIDSNNLLRIGKRSYGITVVYEFNGSIKEVRMFRKNLDSQEIVDLYNNEFYETGEYIYTCYSTTPEGFVNDNTDCNDTNEDINPEAEEVCDAVDNNCDLIIDNFLDSCGTEVCTGVATCTMGVWGDCSSNGNDAGTCALCNSTGDIIYDETQDMDCSSLSGGHCEEETSIIEEGICSAIETCETEVLSTEDCNLMDSENRCESDSIIFDDFTCTGEGTCSLDSIVTVENCNDYDTGLYCLGTNKHQNDSYCLSATCEINNILIEDCLDEVYCNGEESCISGTCYSGTGIDCSSNDLESIETCFNDPDLNPFTWDFFTGFTSTCNEGTDSCNYGTVEIEHTCSVDDCSAECDAENDCLNNSCEETYTDYCNELKLVEYNSNFILDSIIILDTCENTCEVGCTCTDCTTDCSAPAVNEYCVQGVCDAECDSSDDCTDTVCTHLSGCYGADYYDYGNVPNECSANCACSVNSCDSYSISEYDPRCVDCINLSDESTYSGRITKINETYFLNDDVVLCTDTYKINPSFDFGFIGSAFYVNSSDIILNCNDAKILGVGPSSRSYYGIYNNGFDNVEIKNCEITNYSVNIKYKNAVGGSINNNILYKRDGILLSNSNNLEIYNNSIWNANKGISLTNSSQNRIYNNYLNGTGSTSASSYEGIGLFWNSNFNSIDNNTVKYCWDGIRLANGVSTTNITNNNLDYNWMHSLITSNSITNILIENNTANNAKYFGMQIQCVNCSIKNNTANNATWYNGFMIILSENSTFENITANNCLRQGIVISDSHNIELINSKACNNGGAAYEDIKESFNSWVMTGVNTFENLMCDDSDPEDYCDIGCVARERPLPKSDHKSSSTPNIDENINEEVEDRDSIIRIPIEDNSGYIGNVNTKPSQKIKP